MRTADGGRAGATTTSRDPRAAAVIASVGAGWSEENVFFALAAGVMLANVVVAALRLLL